MSTRPKLELTWIGKENRPKPEPIAACVGGRGTAGE